MINLIIYTVALAICIYPLVSHIKARIARRKRPDKPHYSQIRTRIIRDHAQRIAIVYYNYDPYIVATNALNSLPRHLDKPSKEELAQCFDIAKSLAEKNFE